MHRHTFRPSAWPVTSLTLSMHHAHKYPRVAGPSQKPRAAPSFVGSTKGPQP